MASIDLKDCTIKIKDGTTPTANYVTVTIGEGNLTFTENRNVEYQLDRGLLATASVREGDEVPMDVSFEFIWDYYESATDTSSVSHSPTPIEAIKKTGNASDWVSTDDDACNLYAVDIEVTYDPTTCVTGDSEVYVFPNFRYTTIGGDIRAKQLSCSGTCGVKEPLTSRSPASSGSGSGSGSGSDSGSSEGTASS